MLRICWYFGHAISEGNQLYLSCKAGIILWRAGSIRQISPVNNRRDFYRINLPGNTKRMAYSYVLALHKVNSCNVYNRCSETLEDFNTRWVNGRWATMSSYFSHYMGFHFRILLTHGIQQGVAHVSSFERQAFLAEQIIICSNTL